MLSVILLTLLSVPGHISLWLTFWNHTQGRSLPSWMMAIFSGIALAACLLIPVGIVTAITWLPNHAAAVWTARVYLAMVTIASLVLVPTMVRRHRARAACQQALEKSGMSRIEKVEIGRRRSYRSCRGLSKLLLRLPANQSFEIEINTKPLVLPRLPRPLDGLKIAHLSDLHFTGQVDRAFFDHAVDAVNAAQPDLIAITGDLVDEARFIRWIPEILGHLRSRHGTYVILGNHDCKARLAEIRDAVKRAGLFPLSGRLHRRSIDDATVALAANELPWITPATDMSPCPARSVEPQLRILLAHTPDRLPWAQRFDFDLMLAGHTHGGQFWLPGLGPFVCPTRVTPEIWSGVHYRPPTTLHVSRGLSAELPLRINCRPEVTILTLHKNPRKHSARTSRDATFDHRPASHCEVQTAWFNVPLGVPHNRADNLSS